MSNRDELLGHLHPGGTLMDFLFDQPEGPTQALTLWQPYAWLIQMGWKTVENTAHRNTM